MKQMKRKLAMLLAAIMMLTVCCGALGEENRIWQEGDTGETVTWIQTRLKELKYTEAEPTGVFDAETRKALEWFQEDHNLLVTGMADEVTMRILKTETAEARDRSGLDEIEEALTDEGWLPMPLEGYAMDAKSLGIRGNALEIEDEADAGAYWEMPEWNMDEYTKIESNRFLSTQTAPLSTFAADVDTSSYAQFRRRVLSGESIPPDSIRIEEMLNYFHYDYPQPKEGEPFGVTIHCGPCPWNGETRLLQIGLQAKTVTEAERPGYNLVFLIDTSGSMEGADRLDLVKRAFLLMLEELKPEDTVSIVTYANQDRVVLEGVRAGEKTRIMEAISELTAAGGTNGSAGLNRAYEIAEKYFQAGGVNRILLATDGDLNVGVSSEGELARLVTEKKKGGVGLTCLGFGMGNFKDNKMEALADYGDGNCWYIDTIFEARKALVSEAGGTFITVAKDVKLQVDFNPAWIRGYRLIGYEDRLMAAEDFADDTKDGGEIGSGHRVTVLYEIVPADSPFDFGEAQSRYQQREKIGEKTGDMMTLAVRAKEPEGETSRLYEYPVSGEVLEGALDENMKFAAAVAETGMLLRDSQWKGTATWESALELLRDCESVKGDPYKEEFLYLVTLLERAETIQK